MSLFWYPTIGSDSIFNCEYDKGDMLDSYVRYFLSRLQSMFKYEGLPDTIPAKWLEHYLMCNGNCIIAKNDDGDLYAYIGGMGTNINAYYVPQGYIVSNPYFNAGLHPDKDNTEGSAFSKKFVNGIDCVLIYNDTHAQGLLPMLRKYCMQLVENDITMNIADILARATLNISTADDKTKASAELYLNNLKKGKLGVMMDNAFIEGLHVSEFSAACNSLTNLIEYHQYIKASLYNELGLNSNYNMKRESINSNESQLNDDMLHPLIDDMLRERQEGIEAVNKMFGTNIKVTFGGAWLENEKEEQLITNELISDNTDSDNSDMDIEDNVNDIESLEDDTIGEVSEEDIAVPITEDETEDEVIEETSEEVTTDPIEELTEAIEDLTEAIEDDKGGEDNAVSKDN